MKINKLFLLIVAGLSLGNAMPIIAEEITSPTQEQSDVLRQKLTELKQEARLLRGERYIDYRTTAKDMHRALVWATATATAWAGAKASGLNVEAIPFVGPVSLEVPVILTNAFYSAAQSTTFYAVGYAFMRRITYRRINEQLQKHIDATCDFKSLPIEQAMLFLAAFKKDDALLAYLKAEQTEYCKREDVQKTLDGLYEAEQPTWHNLWMMDATEQEVQEDVLTMHL